MEAQNFFVDNDGHARSGWRVLLFVVAFLICAKLFEAFVYLLTGLFLKQPLGNWTFVLGAIILFGSATLVSWGCGAILEDLSFRAVGWWPHRGWLRNLALGSISLAEAQRWGAELQVIGRRMAADYLSGDGTFEHRAHIVALTFAFLFDFAVLVERWSEWAASQISSWPTDGPPQQPDLTSFSRALADKAATPTPPE